jgi:2-keto-4-pentenoate hydratase/2-oxohepta-3-ene-1,7-dioic acid hydratase in catechol pathway
MRIATKDGRLIVGTSDGWVDVERRSDHRFSSDPQEIYPRWAEFRSWTDRLELGVADALDDDGAERANWGAPCPRPRQVFAIGLNYRDHAAEAGLAVPDSPPTFTKFPSCITGPVTTLTLPSSNVDWEVELVAVIGLQADHVPIERAWDHVAGLSVGQDFSERVVQVAGPAPQFSLGKSFPGFGPIGPCLVTLDEFGDPDDLELECVLNGERVQKARTSAMIFSVPELIARLSAICPLLPGDVIFTGTPAGVGMASDPQCFLAPGDEVISRVEGIGALHQTCVGATPSTAA